MVSNTTEVQRIDKDYVAVAAIQYLILMPGSYMNIAKIKYSDRFYTDVTFALLYNWRKLYKKPNTVRK